MLRVVRARAHTHGVCVTMEQDIPANIIKNSNVMSLAGPWKVIQVDKPKTLILSGGQGIPVTGELFMKF